MIAQQHVIPAKTQKQQLIILFLNQIMIIVHNLNKEKLRTIHKLLLKFHNINNW